MEFNLDPISMMVYVTQKSNVMDSVISHLIGTEDAKGILCLDEFDVPTIIVETRGFKKCKKKMKSLYSRRRHKMAIAYIMKNGRKKRYSKTFRYYKITIKNKPR